MGNCNASIGDVDKLRQVQRGILDKTCFTEHRALGQGGFGTVLAVTKNFGTKADRDEFHAMKRLDKDRICACDGMDVLVMGELHFMEEISEDKSKASDFLMKLECAFQDNSHLYLVQSMMEGGDALFVQNSFKNKTLPLEVARWFTACCMVGLEDLHEDHNILHRDIKEENLLIDKDGYAKLADFGMADKLVDGISHSHGGTIVYMSPESRDADSDRTQKKTHDFFAVGVMLFRMLTNKFPFQVATHDYNTVVSMHLTSQLMNDAADDKVKKNLQIEQQDELLGKGDLEKTYQLTDFMKTHIKDPEAVDLISKLLVYDESKRIGAQDGAVEIMQHAFFKAINFHELKEKKLTSPYIPDPSSAANICRGDLDMFEQLAFDDEDKDPVLDPKLNAKFVEFYYNPWHESTTKFEKSEAKQRRMSKLLSSRKEMSSRSAASSRRPTLTPKIEEGNEGDEEE